MSDFAQARALLAVPEGAFQQGFDVRSYETDSSGLATTGTIMRYLEDLATRASAARGFPAEWYEAAGSAFVVRDVRLVFGRFPPIGRSLALSTWVSAIGFVQSNRDYLITESGSEALVVRAQARWAYVDRVTGQPRRIHPELAERIPLLGQGLARGDRHESLPTANVHTSTYEVVARGHESDVQQHTNNAVYADWLNEAQRLSLCEHPLPDLRRLREMRVNYLSPVLAGERITITTDWSRQSPEKHAVSQHIRRADGGKTDVLWALSLYR